MFVCIITLEYCPSPYLLSVEYILRIQLFSDHCNLKRKTLAGSGFEPRSPALPSERPRRNSWVKLACFLLLNFPCTSGAILLPSVDGDYLPGITLELGF